MIYSKKYGRYFKDRSELQRYAWWDYRTKPILPWFGLRDCLYSDEYRKERGLKTREDQEQQWAPVTTALSVFNIIMGVFLLLTGLWVVGLICAGIGAITLWRRNSDG